MQKIAIIVPCYNESERLRFSDIQWLIEHTSATIFFANDGSTDSTIEKLNQICILYPSRCFVIDFKINEGKAQTIYKAMHEVLSRDCFDYIGYFDADFSTPVEEVRRLMEETVAAAPGFLFGSRILLLNSGIKRKIYRHIIGRTIVTILNLRFGLGIYDTQCGAKIFAREIIAEAFGAPFKTSWLFDVEIFVRLKHAGLLSQGKEVPVFNWTDVEGSKLGWRTGNKIIKELYLLMKSY